MAIELKNVSFNYPNGFLANENLNLKIESNEKVAIIGENGAGKTTCVKLMNNLYKPTLGDIIIDGINTKDKTTAEIAKYVGYVFQNPDDQIFNQTVIKELEYMPKYYKMSEKEMKARIEDAIDLCDIREYLDANPFDVPFPIRKFICIASVIITRPKYIILDEPTAGQDARGARILTNIIDELISRNIGVIAITHDMEFVINNFERVVAMAHKNIIADDSKENIFWNKEIVKEARVTQPTISILADKLGIGDKVLFNKDLVELL